MEEGTCPIKGRNKDGATGTPGFSDTHEGR